MISKDAKTRAKSLVVTLVFRARMFSKIAVESKQALRKELEQPAVYHNGYRITHFRDQCRHWRALRKSVLQSARDVKRTFELPAWSCPRILARLKFANVRPELFLKP